MSYYLHNLFPDLYVEKKLYDTLVLSSGSVKGFVLLGALSYLLDNNLLDNVHTYIGTSVGSIVAYLLCIGYAPAEILSKLHMNNWIEKLQEFDSSNLLKGEALASWIYIQEALDILTLNKVDKFLTMAQLYKETGKKLIVCTYNMTKSKVEYLSHTSNPDLPCIVALKMSSNVPILFGRFKYEGNYYVDGALSDSFPILKGLEIGKCIMGINLALSDESLKDTPETGFLDYVFKLIHTPMRENTNYRIEQALKSENCTIVPINCAVTKGLNVPKSQRLEMFSDGYNQMKRYHENAVH